MRLRGAVVLISGAASGLGWGTAQYCVHHAGARVVMLDRDGEAGRARSAELGGQALFVQADLADERQVAAAVERGAGHFGALHACFSFAGVVAPMRILDRAGRAGAGDAFARTVGINLIGTFHLLAHCAQQMAKNAPDDDGERGVVVTISSGAAFDGQIGQTAYASSKAGLVGLCLPAARELASVGIRVNTIAPGAFWTPMLESLPPTVVDRIAADFQFPRRFGRADEIAALCCHIAENRYLNGACIRLDGAFRLPPR
ncbi:MAG: SDR family oxidoreductase [Burkholderiaceae bacterium]